MLTSLDPFFPHPNINGKKWSGYTRLAETIDCIAPKMDWILQNYYGLSAFIAACLHSKK